MADADGMAILLGRRLEPAELAGDLPRVVLVVEEDLACGVGHSGGAGEPCRDAARRSARIQEQQAAAGELGHDPPHRRRLGGQAAAHVIADADVERHAGQRPFEPATHLARAEPRQLRVGLGIGGAVLRLHRYVDQDFVPGGAGAVGLRPDSLGIGQVGSVSGPGRAAARRDRGRSIPISLITRAIEGAAPVTSATTANRRHGGTGGPAVSRGAGPAVGTALVTAVDGRGDGRGGRARLTK